MRKLLAVLVATLVLASAGTALTLDRPQSKTYTEPAVSIQVSDAAGDVTYRLNDGDEKPCDCTDQPIAVIPPDGVNEVTVRDDTDSVTRTFTVDTEPPAVSETSPAGTVYTREAAVRLRYSDVSRVPTGQVQLRLDGDPLNATVGQHWANATVNVSEGTHTVTYALPDEHWRTAYNHNATGSWNFTVPVEPVISVNGPTGITGSSVVVNVTGRDPAGIDTAGSYIDIAGPADRRLAWGGIGDETDAVEHGEAFAEAVTGLPDGVYTATAHVADRKGNAAEVEWNFTVDTTAPSITIPSHVAGDIVTGEERFRFNVSDLSAVERVNLSLGGEQVTATPEGAVYTATVNTSQLEDGGTTLRVAATDAAGNTAARSIALTVDNTAPSLASVEVYPDTARGGVIVTADVTDTATRIVGARYRLEGPNDTAVKDGRLNAVHGEYDAIEEQVRRVIDLSDIDAGNGTYTAFVSARDDAGHEVGGFGRAFTVDRGRTAALEIADTTVRQEIGTTRTFTVSVSNTGEIGELVRLTVDSTFETDVMTAAKRLDAGETKQFRVEATIPDNRSHIGNHSLTVTAEGMSASDTLATELIAQPHPAAREEVRTRLTTLQERFAELNASREGWTLVSDTREKFEATAERLASAEAALEEGRYAAAREQLDAAEEQLAETRSTFTGEVTRARLGAAAAAAAKLLAVLAIIGAVYGGYRLIPPEEGYDPEQGYVHRPGGKHPQRVRAEEMWRRVKAQRAQTGAGSDREERAVERWDGYEH
ncbi:MAG: Ig-like domain-containing protein [Candidatus Nanohaloarchaea archaeon]|nr:Ig-like domain-containing protein [Candidatus Nanohaloarchaea archaeon]